MCVHIYISVYACFSSSKYIALQSVRPIFVLTACWPTRQVGLLWSITELLKTSFLLKKVLFRQCIESLSLNLPTCACGQWLVPMNILCTHSICMRLMGLDALQWVLTVDKVTKCLTEVPSESQQMLSAHSWTHGLCWKRTLYEAYPNTKCMVKACFHSAVLAHPEQRITSWLSYEFTHRVR